MRFENEYPAAAFAGLFYRRLPSEDPSGTARNETPRPLKTLNRNRKSLQVKQPKLITISGLTSRQTYLALTLSAYRGSPFQPLKYWKVTCGFG